MVEVVPSTSVTYISGMPKLRRIPEVASSLTFERDPVSARAQLAVRLRNVSNLTQHLGGRITQTGDVLWKWVQETMSMGTTFTISQLHELRGYPRVPRSMGTAGLNGP